MRIILIFFSFFYLQAYTQEHHSIPNKRNKLISCDISYSHLNYELFHGLTYTQHFSKFSPSVGIKTAVKSLYSSEKIFPEINLAICYRLINKKSFQFGPCLQYINRNQLVKSWHHYNEILLGLQLFLGEQIQFTNSFGIGPFWETFKTEQNKIYSLRSTNFNLKIGVAYAF